jgi:metallo-beta-lactamase family protein
VPHAADGETVRPGSRTPCAGKAATFVRLQFLGATGTVTGSKYLLEAAGKKVLLDCGLFQGYKQLRLRNWAALPFEPSALHAVVLTHAHVDHSGYLPVLVKGGFKGPIHSSEPTRDLCRIMLPDSGHLQEEEAENANRHGWSKHRPALPLYRERDAVESLRRFDPVPVGRDVDLGNGLVMRLSRAGHILGACSVLFADARTSILFSGDLGRPGDPLVGSPDAVPAAEHVVVESTYGDRRHDPEDPRDVLGAVVRRTVKRGGSVVIPAFAVGRAQLVLHHLRELKAQGAIPDTPIFLDSPMAVNVTELFCAHAGDHALTRADAEQLCGVAEYVSTVEESKTLNRRKEPMIIISASGMATGGRVLHHLKARLPDPRNAVLFCGYQAGGTRGADMVSGAPRVKVHGEWVPVGAEVVMIGNLSAHADADEILAWLRDMRTPPRAAYVTHGEPGPADALRKRMEAELGWHAVVPEYREDVTLGL